MPFSVKEIDVTGSGDFADEAAGAAGTRIDPAPQRLVAVDVLAQQAAAGVDAHARGAAEAAEGVNLGGTGVGGLGAGLPAVEGSAT